MGRKRKLFNNPLLASLAGVVLNLYGELVLRTSRIRVQVHPEVDRLVREQRVAVIYALWHRHVFFVPLLRRYERRPVAALLSLHRDAQIVGVAARLRGITLVSGSSSRGGARAYRQLLTWLASPASACITPDGPKGPAGTIKPGVIRLAEQSACRVVPVAFMASRMRRLRSWDRTIVPLPFGCHRLILGAPLDLAGPAGCAAKAERLRQALDGLAAPRELA
ncbi:MAG: DUF374 domain-containing protein [Cyanobium sp. M30B3]|nr:MAG: DUF374 domain-containing protein [Cyanobium sp. M30B3]